MKSHLPRWPTGSPDPAVNILATGVLFIFGFLAIATSFFLLIPVAIGFGVIGLLRWYHYRPPLYSNPSIAAAAEQHAIAANFPDTEAFADSYARRLIDAWHPKLCFPSSSVSSMSRLRSTTWRGSTTRSRRYPPTRLTRAAGGMSCASTPRRCTTLRAPWPCSAPP
jgi:hypothetical protein